MLAERALRRFLQKPCLLVLRSGREQRGGITPDLIKATCLTGAPEALLEQPHILEQQGLHHIMLYPPLNRQYRVIEDFAERVMWRL